MQIYTLICNKYHFELYDIKNDKGEKDNMVLQKPQVVKELKKELESWKKKIGAPNYDENMYKVE